MAGTAYTNKEGSFKGLGMATVEKKVFGALVLESKKP